MLYKFVYYYFSFYNLFIIDYFYIDWKKQYSDSFSDDFQIDFKGYFVVYIKTSDHSGTESHRYNIRFHCALIITLMT